MPGIVGIPLGETAELGRRRLGLAHSAKSVAEVEAGIQVAGIEREGGREGVDRLRGPFRFEEHAPQGRVGGGFSGLARDRPLRTIN